MTKGSAFFVIIISLLFFLSSRSEAAPLLVTLEYYHINDYVFIDIFRDKQYELEEKRQLLYDDLEKADESSRRTLASFLALLEWYQNKQYRSILLPQHRVFSQDFIIEENEARSYGVLTEQGRLDVSFSMKTRKNNAIQMSIGVYFRQSELYSRPSAVIPLDDFILLHESFTPFSDNQNFEMLFIKISRCSPLICKEQKVSSLDQE